MNARATSAGRHRRHLSATALFASGLAAATAGAALGPRYGGELSVAVLDLPPLPGAAGPAVARGAADRLLLGLTQETLLGVDESGLPVPGLVRAWSAAAGGREWTLVLREELRFHDGQPVLAEDAVRSLRRFLRGPSTAAATLAEALDGGQAFRSGTTQDLPGITAPDTGRIVLRFLQPAAVPFAPLAAASAAVSRPDGVGCGPFVPTFQLPGRRMVLAAFPQHARGRPFLDGIQITAVADPAALRSEYQAARVDMAAGEPGLAAPAAILLLVLDPTRSPFDRPSARSALAAALDRGDLVRHLIPGGDAAATLLPPSLLPSLGTDSTPARSPVPGAVVLRVSREVPPLVSQRIVAYLSTVGLQIRVEPTAAGDVLAGEAHLRLLAWSPEVPDPLLSLRELASLAPAPPAVHDALQQAAREPDRDRRRAQLYRAEASLRAEQVLVPAAVFPLSFGVRPRVRAARIDGSGRLVLEDAWLTP